MPEPELETVVPPWVEQCERAFQMIARFDVLTREPVSGPEDAMRDAGLGRVGSRLDVA